MLLEIWEKHKGKILGCLVGVFLSIIYLVAGFWDMIVCIFLIFVGYYIGKKNDLREPWFDWAYIIRWISEMWRKIRE